MLFRSTWAVSASIEVFHGPLVRMCQSLHTSIERSAAELYATMQSAGAKVRQALVVDATAVAAA